MASKTFHSQSQPLHRLPSALWVLLLLWTGYTVLQSLFVTGIVQEPLATAAALVPGLLGVAVLIAVGFTPADLFLRLGRLSAKGLVLYGALLAFYLLAVVPTGRYVGFSWAGALIYAPTGALAQELFFRTALLPALLRALGNRLLPALALHAFFFGLWHIGAAFAGAPISAALMVMMVPMVFGLGWGWQVIHDKTLVWAVVHHALLLVIMSFFSWG